MENLSRLITAKFDLASQLITKLAGQKTTTTWVPLFRSPLSPTEAANALRLELDALRMRYTLCTSHLFLQTLLGGSGRMAARDEFQRIVAAEDFEGESDYLVRRAQAELGISTEDLSVTDNARVARPRGRQSLTPAPKPKRVPPPRDLVREVKTLLNQYSGNVVDCATKTVENSYTTQGKQYAICPDCNVEMLVSSESSELACPECGKVRELVGTVFSDVQFYNQEGQKAKSGSFNPNRHFRFWMDRILAREPEEELGDKDDPKNTCGEKLLEKLRGLVKRDRKILRLITVDDVRAMLKETDRTDLNKNVPLIMRRLTGIGPPQLPESICQRVEKLFSKAIEIGERLRPPGRANRNYYPYYIYKILDAILPEGKKIQGGTEDYRRVLYYIYMQGQDTLDKNDREWEKICQELPEIPWTMTDRGKARRYRPV